MRIKAKLKLLSSVAKSNLTQAFFLSEEYNSKNNFKIYYDKEEKVDFAKIEVSFEHAPSSKFVEAITTDEVEILELEYGFDESETEGEIPKQADESVVEEEISERIEKPEPKEKNCNNGQKKSGRKCKNNQDEVPKIPEIAEIAENSASFDEFVNNVADYIEMGAKKKFFINLINIAKNLPVINWSDIKEQMGTSYKDSAKAYCNSCITRKFKNNKLRIRFLVLVKSIVNYKTFDFTRTSIPGREQSVSMIFNLEERLRKIDITQSIEKRIEDVLKIIKWPIQDPIKEDMFFKVLNSAVRLDPEEMTWDIIAFKVGIPDQSKAVVQMSLSTFVNKKLIMDEKFNVVNFIKKVQSCIILENEISKV